LTDNAKQRDFFSSYGARAAARGTFRVNIMRIGGQPVAMQIASQSDGGYWLFKIGYDEAYARCSPGMLMLLESIRRAAQGGLESYEFLGKSAEWTAFWTETERPNCSLRYYPKSVGGMAALARDGLELGWRRARTSASRLAKHRKAAT
jgi:CelD/BcsL family acetyltransferase involved in cellulose biosynthesis